MSNPVLIELREDTSDNTLNDLKNAGEFQVTLNNPLVLKENDELSLSSVFVDSVATNSGKIVINDDETDFTVKNFLYVNNYESDASLYTPFTRVVGSPAAPAVDSKGNKLVLGLNDGFDYIACENTGSQSNSTKLIETLSLALTPHVAKSKKQEPISFHFKYTAINGQPMKFIVNISKEIDLSDEINRAGHDPNGLPLPAFYTMDDYKKDFKAYPSGFPFDFIDKTLEKDSPFMVQTSGFNGFTGDFAHTEKNSTFTGIKLTPMIFTYNFTIPAGAYDPDEFARVVTDKLADQNINSNDITYTDVTDEITQKYMTSPRSFNSPYLQFSSTLAALISANADVYGCRFDGEGLIKVNNGNFLFGSTQVGMEFDQEQSKFFFSQLHSPFYINKGGTTSMGTKFTPVLNPSGAAFNPSINFVANKIGGVGFTELKPETVWFKKLGFSPDVITNFGVRDFDGAGTQSADYENIAGGAISLTNLSPITFSLIDGKNVTGNFTSLDSAINKTTPRVAPDNATLEDTSQIIKQIYAVTGINQGGSLPYYLIEIEGKGINSDIRGSVDSAIQNNKISAIVSRYYQTLSYTSSMDGSGAIPYIHKGQPLMIDSFKVRILDPDGTITDNIQDSNVVFLQHTPANQ
tara:strand:- start:121 stop:2022 length:1902 start_codon:yes stop_codon:yes gene_type:complete